MKSVVENAPAKVNLYLKVLGRRPDGYHEINTLFEKVNICDKIVIKEAKRGIVIKCRDPVLPRDKNNICYAAADLLMGKYHVRKGVIIDLTKKIPIAAGLGGGSSDAASVIKGLNRLWGLGLEKDELIKLGGIIGSDVAFFVDDGAFSIGTGRGECLDPLESKLSLWHLIVTPDIPLLTENIYRAYIKQHSLSLTSKEALGTIITPKIGINNMGQINMLLHNDLEDVVLQQEPIINKIKKIFVLSGAKKALVSGSGPSVFGLFESRKEATRVKKDCLRRFPVANGWRAFIAETYYE